MKLQKFSTFLTEKISKNEITSALKNKDIRFGAEYEFSLDSEYSISAGRFSEYDLQRLDSEYNELFKEFYDNIKIINKLKSKYYSDYIVNDVLKKQVYPFLKRKIDKVNNKIKKRSDILDDVFTTNKEELEAEIAEITEIELYAIQTELDDIRKAVNSADWSEVYSLLDDFYVKNEKDVEYDNINEWIESEGGYNGSASSRELDDFFNDVSGSYNNTIDSEMESALDLYVDNIEDYEDYDDFAYDHEMELESLSSFFTPSELPDMFDDSGYGYGSGEQPDYDLLPFYMDDALVSGEYHGNEGSFGKWRVETDPSVNGQGTEIISPIQTLKTGLSDMEDMFNFISQYGETDSSAGFHINLSYKNKRFEDADLLKLMLFMDEGQVWNLFPDRKHTTYTNSIKSALNISANRVINNLDTKELIKAQKKNKTSVEALFKAFMSKINLPYDKYFGINLSNSHGSSGRIEFRYMGGSNYHTKYKEIVAQIGRYVHLIVLAFDPDYKKKEYMIKLNKLFNMDSDTFDRLEVKGLNKIIEDGERVVQDDLPIRKIAYGEYIYTIDIKKNKILTIKNLDELTSWQIETEITNAQKRKGKTRGVSEYIVPLGISSKAAKLIYFVSDKKKRLLKIELDKPNSREHIKRVISHGIDQDPSNIDVYKYKGMMYTINLDKNKIVKQEKIKN